MCLGDNGGRLSVLPDGVCGAVDAGVETEALEGGLSDHVEDGVQGDIDDPRRHFAVDGEGDDVGRQDRWRRPGFAVMVAAGGAQGRGSGDGGHPVIQDNLALHPATLAQTGNDGGDQQLFRVGMKMGIEEDAGGHDAGADVRSVVDMHAAIGAEDAGLPRTGNVEPSDALRGEVVASDWIEQAHIQLALRLDLPVGMSEVVERAGELQGAVLDSLAAGGDAQGAQVGGVAGQVKGGLKEALDGPCPACSRP